MCDSGAEAEWLAFGVCLAAKVAAADNVPSGEGLLPAPKAPSDRAREAAKPPRWVPYFCTYNLLLALGDLCL